MAPPLQANQGGPGEARPRAKLPKTPNGKKPHPPTPGNKRVRKNPREHRSGGTNPAQTPQNQHFRQGARAPLGKNRNKPGKKGARVPTTHLPKLPEGKGGIKAHLQAPTKNRWGNPPLLRDTQGPKP
eukprot:UN4899